MIRLRAGVTHGSCALGGVNVEWDNEGRALGPTGVVLPVAAGLEAAKYEHLFDVSYLDEEEVDEKTGGAAAPPPTFEGIVLERLAHLVSVRGGGDQLRDACAKLGMKNAGTSKKGLADQIRKYLQENPSEAQRVHGVLTGEDGEP